MQAGLRAYVGKVCMDRNSPDYYQHSQEQNLADTHAFVRHIRSPPKDAQHSQHFTPILISGISFPRKHGITPPSCNQQYEPRNEGCNPENLCGLSALTKTQTLSMNIHTPSHRHVDRL